MQISKKDKTTAGILGILLGSIGAVSLLLMGGENFTIGSKTLLGDTLVLIDDFSMLASFYAYNICMFEKLGDFYIFLPFL